LFSEKKQSFFSENNLLKEYYWLGKKAEGLFTQPQKAIQVAAAGGRSHLYRFF
jgi:hypothetical protein